MNKLPWHRFAFVLLVRATAEPAPAVAGQQSDTRAEFMRQKLQYSNGLLEGLTREDYVQIAKNAKALKGISQASMACSRLSCKSSTKRGVTSGCRA